MSRKKKDWINSTMGCGLLEKPVITFYCDFSCSLILSHLHDTIIYKSKRSKIMIDTKKEQERDELHHAIWAIADDIAEIEV